MYEDQTSAQPRAEANPVPPTPPHIVVMRAQGEVALICTRICRAMDDPERRHELPGHWADLLVQMDCFHTTTAQAMPDAHRAFLAGLRSTNDLHASEKVGA